MRNSHWCLALLIPWLLAAQPTAAATPTPAAPLDIGGPFAQQVEPPEPPAPPPPQETPQPPGGVVGNIVQTIQNIWQVSTYLPEKTFRRAIEKSVRGIAQSTITETQEALTGVVDATIFNGMMIVGAAQLPDAIKQIGDWLARAAVPLWAISLAVMGVAVMTRNAVGLGYGSNDAAYETVRWAFIAIASGNGFALVNLGHGAFGALQAVLLGGAGASAGSMVEALLPDYLLSPNISIIFLILALIVAFVTVVVMIVAWVARFLLLSSVAALAPLAIATEGIPFTRFIFRDWLSMFVRLELVGVLNAFIFVLLAALGGLFNPGAGVFGALLRIVMMVGLASAIIGVNWSVFNQVFGTAIAAAEQAKSAFSQIAGVLAFAGAAVATGGKSALTLPEGAGSALSGVGSAVGSNVMRSAGAGLRQGSTHGTSAADPGAGRGAGLPQPSSSARPPTAADRRRAVDAERANREFARGLGAVGDRDTADTVEARDRLSGALGAPAADAALGAAAPLLTSMSKAFGGLTQAAKRAGYSTAAELTGAVAEDVAHQDSSANGSSRLFGESFAERATAANPGTPRSDWIQPFDFGMGLKMASALHQPWAAPEFANAAFMARTDADDIGRMLEAAGQAGQAHAEPREAEAVFREVLPGISPAASTLLPPMNPAAGAGL